MLPVPSSRGASDIARDVCGVLKVPPQEEPTSEANVELAERVHTGVQNIVEVNRLQ